MPKKKVNRKKVSNKAKEIMPSSSTISVTLKRARNGYVVSSYSDKLNKDITYIATTKAEAKEQMDKILKGR